MIKSKPDKRESGSVTEKSTAETAEKDVTTKVTATISERPGLSRTEQEQEAGRRMISRHKNRGK